MTAPIASLLHEFVAKVALVTLFERDATGTRHTMSNSDFQVNDYADRVAEITTVYRTESKDIVEVEGFWADTGNAFDRQFLPSAMRLAAGELVYVIQQVKGPRGVGTWVGFQSAKAPKGAVSLKRTALHMMHVGL
ncbi:hypothetical protein [Sphingomonas sp. RS2018]